MERGTSAAADHLGPVAEVLLTNGMADHRADALALAAAGFAVHPVRLGPGGSKTPYLAHGHLDASTDPTALGTWWRRWPDAVPGVALPDRTVVVDLDTYKPEYDPAHGLTLPATAMQETGRSGWQLLYRTDGRPVRQATNVRPAIDTRVAGKGWIVAWEPRTLIDNPVATWAEAPAWLYDAKPREAGEPETMGTRAEILAWLGKVAYAVAVPASAYRAMLTAARDEGSIVALDPARPWTDNDLATLAAEAAKWDTPEEPPRVRRDDAVEVPEARGWPAPPEPAAFVGILGDITNAVAPCTEADPVGVLGTLVSMFGAACGSGRSLYQGSLQRLNTSILLVGATGFGGRKGTALDVGRSVFRLAYPELDGLWLVGVASGEAITGHLGRAEPEERVFLVEPEFGRLLTIMNREGSTLSAVLRNAWDGVPLGHARSRDESLVSSHHVSLLGHVTPTELRAKLTGVDAANGFANRILFLAVRRQQLIPFPESPDALVGPYVEALHRAIVEARAGRELAFDGHARDRWEAFYAELAVTPRLGLAGAVTGRHEAQVARLALLYATADRAAAISVGHLEAAIALADFARRSAVWALGDSTGNRHADVLLQMLEDGPMGYDDAKRSLGLRTSADMADAVAVLVEAGLADVTKVARPGGGRPTRGLRAKGAKGAKGVGALRTEKQEILT